MFSSLQRQRQTLNFETEKLIMKVGIWSRGHWLDKYANRESQGHNRPLCVGVAKKVSTKKAASLGLTLSVLEKEENGSLFFSKHCTR